MKATWREKKRGLPGVLCAEAILGCIAADGQLWAPSISYSNAWGAWPAAVPALGSVLRPRNSKTSWSHFPPLFCVEPPGKVQDKTWHWCSWSLSARASTLRTHKAGAMCSRNHSFLTVRTTNSICTSVYWNSCWNKIRLVVRMFSPTKPGFQTRNIW